MSVPTLTIVNKLTSTFVVQDPTGETEGSIKVEGSATLSVDITTSELEALKPLLNTAQNANRIT